MTRPYESTQATPVPSITGGWRTSARGDHLHAMADYGHFLLLKFGILGIAIRLCILAIAVAIVLGFNFK